MTTKNPTRRVEELAYLRIDMPRDAEVATVIASNSAGEAQLGLVLLTTRQVLSPDW